jgi:bacteriorhodopsin
MQALVGLASALILVLPLAFALRPDSLRWGLLFIAAFAVSVIVGHIAFGGTPKDLLSLLALPDMWTFLIGCLGIVWWAYSRKAVHNAA